MLTRRVKRAMAFLSVPVLAAAATLALPAVDASASTLTCNRFKSGGVTFSVCVAKVNSKTAKAEIGKISGTFVSGNLALYKGKTRVKDSCSAQWHAGSSCSFNDSGGSGSYHSVWFSNSGGTFPSPTISV